MSIALPVTSVEQPSRMQRSRHLLKQALDHGAHFLPSQGPIETFIHHNTLHAYEDLPFHQALAVAGQTYGAAGYLPESDFRGLHRAGRIADRDLREAAARRGIPWPTDGDDRFTHRGAILKAALCNDLDPLPIAHIRWLLAEERDAWPAHLRDLSTACIRAVDRVGTPAPTPLRTQALQWLDDLGRHSHRDILLAMTGHDICVAVDAWFIRVCGQQLDEGLAADPRPDRTVPLYDAWRRFTRAGRGVLRGLPRTLELPVRADDGALLVLEQLGVPMDRWKAYVSRVLLHLPGWAGMIRWRETNPGYRPQLPPVALMDYLAVRLLGEWAELNLAMERFWGVRDGAQLLPTLRARPNEAAARLALFSGRLTAHQAMAVRAAKAGPAKRREQRFADLVDEVDDDRAPLALSRASQLMRACLALDISSYDLESTEPARVAELLDGIDRCPEELRLPIWQDAYEIHYRNNLLEALADNRRERTDVVVARPTCQAITCFDDREEGFRRHLEEVAPGCQTFGTAGFFGLPISFRGRNDDEFANLCPLGVTPAHEVVETAQAHDQEISDRFDRGRSWLRRWRGHWREILGDGWASLIGAYAVAFFAWVRLVAEIMFPSHFERMKRPVLAALMPLHPTVLRPGDPNAHSPSSIAGFSLAEQVDRVTVLLENIGLTQGFARIIAVLGHGSTSKNNPHMSAYDCGACGGRHGAPNARLFAQMANSSCVRAGLRSVGIDIPDDVWFVGGEHNTANEDVLWSDIDAIPSTHRDDFAALLISIDEARQRHAHERCRKFAHAPPNPSLRQALVHVQERALDPSQARPELGHVTIACGIIGRRELTRGLFLDRRALLISYDPDIDPDGEILERLLLAAGPVGGGISLEYYFSRVDNLRYGAGTKLPHNVVGLVGVLDGGSGDLRTGLPKQMIEIHEPMRLQLFIEASQQAILGVCERAPTVRTMVSNSWILVTAIDPTTGAASVYDPDKGFVPWTSRGLRLPRVERSVDWYRGHMDFLPPARISASVRREEVMDDVG